MSLSKPVAFYLQASMILLFLAGSIAPTPLYVVYQAEWGLSATTITFVFGIYAFAVLCALLVVGSLSDYVGRRPVLLASAALEIAAMTLFANAHGLGTLIAARVVQGLGTGTAAGAIGAGMLDIDRPRGTLANSIAPMLGTASGGLLSGLAVQYLPAPTQLIYWSLGAVFVAQAIGVVFMPETAMVRPGAIASLRPNVGVPARLRRPLLLASPALVGVWALAGFYGALGPSLVRHLTGSRSLLLGGTLVFVLAFSGVLAVLFTRELRAERLMRLGSAALFLGVGLTLLGVAVGSVVLFFLGTAIAGTGFGGGFQGGIRSIVPLTQAQERAGVLSVVWAICYLALALPVVFAGLRAAHSDVFTAAREYGLAVMSLAALAFVGSLSRRRVAIVPAP